MPSPLSSLIQLFPQRKRFRLKRISQQVSLIPEISREVGSSASHEFPPT